MKEALILFPFRLIVISIAIFFLVPEWSQKRKRLLPTNEELAPLLTEFYFAPPPETCSASLSRMGEKIFFDPRFSSNGKISCASCHKSEFGFADNRRLSFGLEETKRRAPSLLNVFAQHWFFWDGRKDSLETQALAPIEEPAEHNFTRTEVATLIGTHYTQDYEQNFGEFPTCLLQQPLPRALPRPIPNALSPLMGAYALASLNSLVLKQRILAQAADLKIPPYAMMSRLSESLKHDPTLFKNWDHLTPELQDGINSVFTHVGEAIACYEKTLIAINSPFDRFVAKVQSSKTVVESLNEEFQESALEGLRLFLGEAQCNACHSGPFFSDQQFHNIGLPLKGEHIDLGRGMGVVEVLNDPQNCAKLNPANASESCRELPWLDPDNIGLVGAFKTPSLRNVAKRPFLGHDGRFASIEEILEHYSKLGDEPEIGHREETLKPLGLSEGEKKNLRAFLEALTSD